MIKKIRRVLCAIALLALSALGFLACTKEQAQQEAKQVEQQTKDCLLSDAFDACIKAVLNACDAGACTAKEQLSKVVECSKVCLQGTADTAGKGGADAR